MSACCLPLRVDPIGESREAVGMPALGIFNRGALRTRGHCEWPFVGRRLVVGVKAVPCGVGLGWGVI